MDQLTRNAESGNAEAQYKLGNRFLNGASLPKDTDAGMRWLRRSADGGFVNAMLAVGMAYEHGYGVPINYVESIAWLERATAKGSALAKCELGLMYEQGHGVPKDESHAAKLYEEAAAMGLPLAKFDLAYLYENGLGVAANPQKAVLLYEEAAPEIFTARLNLASLHANGTGVPHDLLAAATWTFLAMNKVMEQAVVDDDSRHMHEAALYLVRLESEFKLTKKQEKEAKHRASQWLIEHHPSDERFGASLKDR